MILASLVSQADDLPNLSAIGVIVDNNSVLCCILRNAS